MDDGEIPYQDEEEVDVDIADILEGLWGMKDDSDDAETPPDVMEDVEDPEEEEITVLDDITSADKGSKDDNDSYLPAYLAAIGVILLALAVLIVAGYVIRIKMKYN
jgi:hypothetical protein